MADLRPLFQPPVFDYEGEEPASTTSGSARRRARRERAAERQAQTSERRTVET